MIDDGEEIYKKTKQGLRCAAKTRCSIGRVLFSVSVPSLLSVCVFVVVSFSVSLSIYLSPLPHALCSRRTNVLFSETMDNNDSTLTARTSTDAQAKMFKWPIWYCACQRTLILFLVHGKLLVELSGCFVLLVDVVTQRHQHLEHNRQQGASRDMK